MEHTYIYGKHAVTEAIMHAPHSIEKVFISSHLNDEKILSLIKKSGVSLEKFDENKIPKEIENSIGLSATHQGIIALISVGKIVQPYKTFIQNLPVGPDGKVGTDTALVLLGGLDDPQNVGAVIRSAAAFGIAGVLIPEHKQAPVTGTVVKVSAGMAFRIPLVSIGNINTTVRDLKDRGFWIYGLDGESTQSIVEEKFDAPAVFILGNEAKGIREKTREECDILLSIPTHPQCESLNAAASTAVALFTWSVQHKEALASHFKL